MGSLVFHVAAGILLVAQSLSKWLVLVLLLVLLPLFLTSSACLCKWPHGMSFSCMIDAAAFGQQIILL